MGWRAARGARVPALTLRQLRLGGFFQTTCRCRRPRSLARTSRNARVCLHVWFARDHPGAKRRSQLGHEVIPGIAPRGSPCYFPFSLPLIFEGGLGICPHRILRPGSTPSHRVLGSGSAWPCSCGSAIGRCVVTLSQGHPPPRLHSVIFSPAPRLSSGGPGPTRERALGGGGGGRPVYPLRP